MDSPPSQEKVRNQPKARKLLLLKYKLFDQLLTKHHALLEQLLVKQHELNCELIKQCQAGMTQPKAPVSDELSVSKLLVDAGLLEANEAADPKLQARAAATALKRKSPSPEKAPAEKTSPQTRAIPKSSSKNAALEALGRVPIKYWSMLAVLTLAASYYYWPAGNPTSALAGTALSASDPEQRLQALMTLSMSKGADALPLLRKVASESKDADVQANAMQRLAECGDADSIGLFLVGLENADAKVRRAAYAALKAVGGGLREEVGFGVNDPPNKRAEAVRELRSNFPGGKRMMPTEPSQ
jgi:HEAT repeat protein